MTDKPTPMPDEMVRGMIENSNETLKAIKEIRGGDNLRYNCDNKTEKQEIIKAAIQAIEDIMPSSHDQCPENSVCHLCDILTLEPHLEALKGLTDEKM